MSFWNTVHLHAATRLCNSNLFHNYHKRLQWWYISVNPSPQTKRKKILNPVHFCQTETLLDLQRAGGWEKLLYKTWISWQAWRLVLYVVPRFHSENNKTSGQENISSDLLLYLKGWFSFVIVFRAPFLSSLLFLQPNKLAIEYKN